jgi:hypothetical protein
VLLFRTLTFGVPIPIGALTYLIWRRKEDWRTGVSSRTPGTNEEATATAQ